MSPFPEIPGYRIERRLGEGGMASVYLATQLSLDRPVAIKVVHFRGAHQSEMSARFEHEARTIARLEHPSIVGIYEVGRTRDGSPYYSMAYLPNGDLAHAELNGDTDRIEPVLRAIAEALRFAHAHGVVHRDIKPDNVLFDREKRARLADFGISRSLGSARVTTDGNAVGSAAYMSPEQARGHEVDARSDLYSLGVMAFELLTGRLPYRGPDAVSMALAHHSEPIPRLPDNFARWQPLIDRTLAKLPSDRVQSADEFIALLDHIVDPSGANRTEVLPAFSPSASGATAPKRRWTRPLLLLVALAAMAALWQRHYDDGAFDEPVVGTREIAVTRTVVTTDPLIVAIQKQIDAQHWFEPAEGSASALLAQALAASPDADLQSTADEFVQRVRNVALSALDKDKVADGIRLIGALRGFISAQKLGERGPAREFEAALGKVLEARVVAAEQADDPSLAADMASLIEADAALSARLGQLGRQEPGQLVHDEGGPPLRGVQIGERWIAMGEHEVTRGEYAVFSNETKREAQRCAFGGNRSWEATGFTQDDRHPVVCVSYDDARAYAKWLSQRTGQRYRLPTAAEWRQAALGVDANLPPCTLGNVYGRDGRDLTLRTRHDCKDEAEDTSPVGAYAASAQGIHDLVGNVGEWVSDCSVDDSCEARLIMGSSYRDGSNSALLDLHDTRDGDSAALDVGFRVVRGWK